MNEGHSNQRETYRKKARKPTSLIELKLKERRREEGDAAWKLGRNQDCLCPFPQTPGLSRGNGKPSVS